MTDIKLEKNIHFVYNKNQVKVVDVDPNELKKILKPAVYQLVFIPEQGFFLSYMFDKYEMPSNIFGDIVTPTEKVLDTFKSEERKNKNTGVLLSGEKGSGKTLLAKNICNQGLEQGLPVIVVSSGYAGTAFNNFLSDLGDIIVFIDEFEKIYSSDDKENRQQDVLLALFDGSNKTVNKILFVLTINDIYKINDYLKNRPSRILYHITYSGLEKEVITQYIDLNLKNVKFKESIIEFCDLFDKLNLDMLASLVEEVDRQVKRNPNVEFKNIVKDLNMKPFSTYTKIKTYKISVKMNGKEITRMSTKYTNENPLIDNVTLRLYFSLYLDDFIIEDSDLINDDFDEDSLPSNHPNRKYLNYDVYLDKKLNKAYVSTSTYLRIEPSLVSKDVDGSMICQLISKDMLGNENKFVIRFTEEPYVDRFDEFMSNSEYRKYMYNNKDFYHNRSEDSDS